MTFQRISRRFHAALATLLLAASVGVLLDAQDNGLPEPQFDGDALVFPEDYRDWVFLSSGLGMTYGPSANPDGPPLFDNVFAAPEAYRAFLATGRWLDHAMFVLEIRDAVTDVSINSGGRSQQDVRFVEVSLKDESRFGDDAWGYFDFSDGQSSASPLPRDAACYSCHRENGAVDNTFVQFYPTLRPIAEAHGTLRANVQ